MKTCCGKPTTIGLLALGAILGAAAVGFFVGRGTSLSASSLAGTSLFGPGAPLMLDASASAIGEEFSMATGPISQDAEGIFVLDHASGLLQCNVLYPRAGQFGAAFQANVKEALAGGGKNGKYLMVTGAAQFPGASNRGGFANCVVYVLDQSSGAYVCYSIPFNESLVNSRAPQMGVMLPIATGFARQALDRDALR